MSFILMVSKLLRILAKANECQGPTEDECGIGRHQRCGDQGVELMAELEMGLAQEFLMKDEWHSNSVNIANQKHKSNMVVKGMNSWVGNTKHDQEFK